MNPSETPAPEVTPPIPEVYANAMSIHGGPFDVLCEFGYRGPAAGETLTEDETVVRVRMSWAHLKTMLPVLSHLVATYEREHGVIPAPGFSDDPERPPAH